MSTGLDNRAHESTSSERGSRAKRPERHSTPERPRFVAGSIGPTTKAISVTGGVTFEDLHEHFYVQAQGLFDGGVDYLLLETCQDTRNIKAGLLAIERLFEDNGRDDSRRGLGHHRADGHDARRSVASKRFSPRSPIAICSTSA